MEICKQQSTIGKWRYASSKAKKGNGDMQAANKGRWRCATYPQYQYMVMWEADRFKRYGR